MKEQENKLSPSPIEQIRQQLWEQIDKAEFGSAGFQAASDFFALERHWYVLGIEQDNVVSAGEDKRKRLSWESQTRIREIQIALLKREIESNESRIPGYSRAYSGFSIAFDELGTIAHKEAKIKYPSDKTRQKTYSEDIYSSIHDEIYDIIISRQSQS